MTTTQPTPPPPSSSATNSTPPPPPQSQPQPPPQKELPILRRSNTAKSRSVPLRDVTPVCVIVVGMAGSGKTTFTAALQRSLALPPPPSLSDDGDGDGDGDVKKGKEENGGGGTVDEEEGGGGAGKEKEKEKKKPVGYCVNLDPATKLVPFGASIDIRDTVNYKEVMKQHNLGPNGAIMTSLNLFSTKFDQVLSILEQRSFSTIPPPSSSSPTTSTNEQKNLDYILIDTPGQIEAFTWSASGSILTSALASSFPTVLAFIVDTPRCVRSLDTFLSNMLYACSMYYRTKLPLVVVFNKTDVVGWEVCRGWMEDFETFQNALDEWIDSGAGSGYFSTLTRSLSLVLDEFYSTLRRVGVSAGTGDGVEDFWVAVDGACEDFDVGYGEDLRLRIEEKGARERAVVRDGLERLREDMGAGGEDR